MIGNYTFLIGNQLNDKKNYDFIPGGKQQAINDDVCN